MEYWRGCDSSRQVRVYVPFPNRCACVRIDRVYIALQVAEPQSSVTTRVAKHRRSSDGSRGLKGPVDATCGSAQAIDVASLRADEETTVRKGRLAEHLRDRRKSEGPL